MTISYFKSPSEIFKSIHIHNDYDYTTGRSLERIRFKRHNDYSEFEISRYQNINDEVFYDASYTYDNKYKFSKTIDVTDVFNPKLLTYDNNYYITLDAYKSYKFPDNNIGIKAIAFNKGGLALFYMILKNTVVSITFNGDDFELTKNLEGRNVGEIRFPYKLFNSGSEII